MFGKRSRKNRKQARQQQQSKRSRLARLMSRAPRVESLEARQLLAVDVTAVGGSVFVDDNIGEVNDVEIGTVGAGTVYRVEDLTAGVALSPGLFGTPGVATDAVAPGQVGAGTFVEFSLAIFPVTSLSVNTATAGGAEGDTVTLNQSPVPVSIVTGDGADGVLIGNSLVGAPFDPGDDLDFITAGVTVNAGLGVDSLTIDDSADVSFGNGYSLTSSTFSRSGPFGGISSYTGVQTLDILTAAGIPLSGDTNSVFIDSTSINTNTTVIGGGYNESFFVTTAGSDLSALGGPLELVGGGSPAGDFGDTVFLDDSLSGVDRTYDLSDSSLSFSGGGSSPITISDIEGVSLAGGLGDDDITVTPSATTAYFVDGFTEAFGDTLNVDAAGADLTLDFGVGIIVDSLLPIGFAGIEEHNFTDVDDFIALGADGPSDEAFLTGNSGIGFNATFFFDSTLDAIPTGARINLDAQSATYDGRGGNDRLQIDETIDGLPSFDGTAPAAFTNSALASDAGFAGPANVGIHVVGGTGGDGIGLNLSGAAHTARYYSGDLPALFDNSGNIAVDGEFTLSFESLDPIDVLGFGAASTLIVDATATPGTTFLTIDDDAALAGPWDVLFGAPAPDDGVTGIVGDGGFENTRFGDFGTVIVRGGDGSETITLAALDMGVVGPLNPALASPNPITAITLDGENTTSTDPATDFLIVETLPAAVTADVTGGGGDDFIFIAPTTGSLDGVMGTVVVAGEADTGTVIGNRQANAKGNNVTLDIVEGDVLQVFDNLDATGNMYDLDDGQIDRDGTAGVIDYASTEQVFLFTSSAGGNDINVLDTTDGIYTRVDGGLLADDVDVTDTGISSILEIRTAAGADDVDVATTGAGSVTIISGGNDDDAITLADSGAGAGVALLGGNDNDTINVDGTGGLSVTEVRGNSGADIININATGVGSFTDVFGDAGDDVITVDGSDPNTLDGILGAVCVFGGTEDDLLIVNDEDDTDDNAYYVNPNDVTRYEVGGGSPDVVIEYDEIETLNVIAGEGEDKVVFNESTADDVFLDGNLPTGVAGDPVGDQLVITALLTVEPIRNKTDGNFVTAGGVLQPTGPTFVTFVDFEHVVWQDRYEMNDVYDPANDIDQSYDLGSEPEVIEADLSIHSDTDVDFFSWTANVTGKAIINALFNHELGDLQMNVRDSAGNIIASSDTADDNEQLIIPVVAQEVYIIEILSVPDPDPAICNANTYSLEIENFAAPQPEVDLIDASDTGMMLNDDYTADDTPTIEVQADLSAWLMGIPVDQGVGTPGVEVVISASHFDTGAVTTVIADRVDPGTPNNNLWQGTLPDLTDGQYFIEAWVRVEDGQDTPAIGRGILSEPLPITVDTAPPAAMPAPILLDASNTGSLADTITSKMQPAFDGEAGSAEPYAKIRLYANGEPVGATVATVDGAWEITSEPLRDGDYDITVEQEDLAGNVSVISEVLVVTIDAEPPQRPTIDLVDAHDTGMSEYDNVTQGNAADPQTALFRITGDVGDDIELKDGDQVINGVGPVPAVITIPAAGEVFVTVDFADAGMPFPAEGPHPMSVHATDAAANRTQSEDLLVEVDNTAPAVDSFALSPHSNSGSQADSNTDITTPTFNGRAEANAKVRLYVTDGFNGRILVGTSFVGSDDSDASLPGATNDDDLGLFEVTVAGALAHNDYNFEVEVEDLAGNVTTFGDVDVVIDPYEFNDTNATATQLGSPETVFLGNVVHHGDGAPNPDGSDIDVFAYTAHSTGKLIVNMIPQGANGDLDIQVQDFGGLNMIASNNPIGDTESVVLPVVAGETYYIRAFAAAGQDPFNFQLYDLEIENFAAPAPTDVTLDPNDDSGMMNNDLITQVNDARLFVKADLQDFADMGITILTSEQADAGDVAGAAVELFINGASVGFADPFLGLPTLFEITLEDTNVGPWANNIPITTGTSVAADNAGYFNIVQAAVRIFDLQTVTATSRTQLSQELDVHYDPNTPDASLATIDMLDASDTGFSVTDNVTAKMSPAFQGVAEENTKIRLYADLNQDGNPELVGQTVTGSDSSDVGIIAGATDEDGLGLWEITVEPLQDGTYDITIEIEDVAGNSSDQADGPSLVAVIDTLPPQRPTVDLVGMDVQDSLTEYDFTGALVITPDVAPENSDTGLSTHDDITRGLNPQNPGGDGETDVLLRVSAEPDTQVDIKDGETIIATFTMPNEEFVFVRLTLDEDPHPISAEATDLAGNRSAQSEELLVTADVTPPNAAAQTDLIESSDTFDDFTTFLSGPLWTASDDVTAINRPAFSGVAEKNTIVRIYAVDTVTTTRQLIGEGLVGSDESAGAVDDGLGLYEVTVEPLADGNYDIIVQLEDTAGNISTDSEALNVTIDTLAPQRPTVDLFDVDDTGRSDMDDTTIGDPTQANGIVDVRYSAELNSRVIIKDGETVIDDFQFTAAEDAAVDGIVDGFGVRTINFVANAANAAILIPAEGAHPISVEAFDVPGNRSAQSEELLITVDFTPPEAPSTPDLNASSDSGMFNNDNVTSIQEAHFVGTAEANSHIRIYATPISGALPAAVLGVPQLVGEGVVRSDESDGDGTDGLGVWEVTVEPLEDAIYEITAEVEDKAGNVSQLSDSLTIEVDTYKPNTPYLDLIATSDSGRNDEDNVTNDTTPTFTMSTQDDPDDPTHLIAENYKFRLYVRPEAAATAVTGEEIKLYDSFVEFGDFTSLDFLQRSINAGFPFGGALPEGYHNFKLEVEDRAGNISDDYLLDVIIDTTPYQGDINLHPESDSGVWGYPATMTDRITSDKVPDFFGVAEADNIVTLTIDGNLLAGTTVAVPLDGNDAFQPQNAPNQNVEANWVAGTVQNLADGQHSIVATFEDLAGNRINSDALLFFVDTQGPRVTDVQVNSVLSNYDLFDPKPSEDGPTPRTDALVISVSDLPARTAAFLYDPIYAPLALNPGHYTLVGDDVGIIPIADIDYETDVDPGDPATGVITLRFDEPLPDDRYTLTLSDSLADIAGNGLDGESNADEPQEDPELPSGDGVHGGDFVARFTIDSRPEIAVWSQGVVYADINGNFVWDPDAEDNDHTNKDFVYNFGEITDAYFAGNFSTGEIASGFDKLGAYGAFNGQYQFFLDTDDDGVGDFVGNMFYQVNAIPVAGNFFNSNADDLADRPRDEIGAYDGQNWYLDFNGNNHIDNGEILQTNMHGVPMVGDFNGDGFDDLATYNNNNGVFQFDLDRDGFADDQLLFGFHGFGEKPVTGDVNLDGVDDIVMWVPGQEGVLPKESGEFHFLVSDDPVEPQTLPRHFFEIVPGFNLGSADPAPAAFSPDPLGNDLFAQFGDEFALPIIGNFDPPVASSGRSLDGVLSNKDNPLDTNRDGKVSGLDALLVINALGSVDFDPTANPLRVVASLGGNKLDASQDGSISTLDALFVINGLAVESLESEGELLASEDSGAAWAASVASAINDVSDDDDDLLDLLAADQQKF